MCLCGAQQHKVRFAMPTRNIPEASKIQVPLYSGHAPLLPMVSTLEMFHCIPVCIDFCDKCQVIAKSMHFYQLITFHTVDL